MTVAGWLNEHALALQAVILTYGLLSPIIFYKVINLPTIQVRECSGLLSSIGELCSCTRTVHIQLEISSS